MGRNDAEVLGAVMSNFRGVRFPEQCYNPGLLRKGRPILEMLWGVKDRGASIHVSIHSEQDSKAREELEFRERERESDKLHENGSIHPLWSAQKHRGGSWPSCCSVFHGFNNYLLNDFCVPGPVWTLETQGK